MKLAWLLWRHPEPTHTFVRRELDALRALGHQVTAVAWELLPGAEGGEVLAFPRRPIYLRILAGALATLIRHPLRTWRAARWGLAHQRPKDVAKALWLAHHLRRGRYDALHAPFVGEAAELAFIAHLAGGIPWGLTAHAADIFCPRPSAGDLLRGAGWVVAISRYAQGHIRARWSVEAEVVRCAPWSPAPSADPPASEEGGAGLTLLTVARCIPKKGLGDALAAAQLLADRGLNFTWDVVGDGPLRPALIEEAQRRGLAGRLRFPGAEAEASIAARYRRGVHAFVFTGVVAEGGDQDGIPVAMLDAMAAGVPVVATGVSGIPEALGAPPDGALVNPGDPRAVADAVAALAADPAGARQLGARGQARVARAFDGAEGARRLAALIARRTALQPPSE